MNSQILDAPDDFDGSLRIVTVKHFDQETEAYLFTAQLRAAGIPNFLSNSTASAALPLLPSLGIGVHVLEEDLPDASKVLARMQYRQQNPPEEKFFDADHEDIIYQQTLTNSKKKTYPVILSWLIVVILLLLIRAWIRAIGWANFYDPAF